MSKKNKIIFVAGDLDPNKSYEFHNFLKPLEKMGNDVIPFDFMKILLDSGREKMNLKLLSFVKEHLPDMVIFIPQTDEFIPEIIDDIAEARDIALLSTYDTDTNVDLDSHELVEFLKSFNSAR